MCFLAMVCDAAFFSKGFGAILIEGEDQYVADIHRRMALEQLARAA